MAQYLVVDWDETACRCLVASLQKDAVSVSHARSIPRISDPVSNNINDDTSASRFDFPLSEIQQFCKEQKIANTPVLVSLRRSQVDWLYQNLPPCSEAELPVLLKNQVLRELPHIADFDPLDYLVLDNTSGNNRVLALTIPLIFRQRLTKTFHGIRRPLRQLGFCAVDAAEAAFCKSSLWEEENENPIPTLIVHAAGSEADLILANGKRIVAIRSFHLSEQNDLQQLSDEIERTVAIGFEGADSLSIGRLILFGTELAQCELAEKLSNLPNFDVDIRVINPFALPGIDAAEKPEQPADFAALIGSLLALQNKLQNKTRNSIDLLNPKEAPKPPNYTRQIVLAIVFFGIVGFGFYHWNSGVVQQLETKLAEIQKEHKKVADELRLAQPSWNVLRQTQLWETQNVIWLDVLKDLSQVLPNSNDLMLTQMTFSTGGGNNPRIAGTVSISGMVRDPSVLLKLQNDLRASKRYDMQNPAPTPNPLGGGYPWLFKATAYRLR
jgi:hypothetical protein